MRRLLPGCKAQASRVFVLFCMFSRVIIVLLHAVICSINECANPRPSGRRDTLLQLPLFTGARSASLHDSSSERSQNSKGCPFATWAGRILPACSECPFSRICYPSEANPTHEHEHVLSLWVSSQSVNGIAWCLADSSIYQAAVMEISFDRLEVSLEFLVLGMQSHVFSLKFSICWLQPLLRVEDKASAPLTLDPAFGHLWMAKWDPTRY